MDKFLVIAVSQADIDKANEIRKANACDYEISCSCPITLSNRRKGNPEAWTGIRTFGLENPCESEIEFKLPPRLVKFVDDYDARQPVKPITVRFRLRKG